MQNCPIIDDGAFTFFLNVNEKKVRKILMYAKNYLCEDTRIATAVQGKRLKEGAPCRAREDGGLWDGERETDSHPVPRAWAEHALSPQNVRDSVELVINGSETTEKTLGRSVPERKQ